MDFSVAFSLLLIALCLHGYGALPAVESTTEGKNATPKGKLEAKAGGISVRFGAYETNDGDQLTFPGISNRAFGSFGSSSSSSPSSSSGSSSSSATSSSSYKRVGGEGDQTTYDHPGRPAGLQQSPPSPCRTCCSSSPCGGATPPTGGAYIPDQVVYRPPPPPPYGGSGGYYPGFSGNPYPGFVHGGSGGYSNSQASSSAGSYNKHGNGYHHGGNQIIPGYPGGGFGQNNHIGGGNSYYPARPVGSGSSASSSANSYAGGNDFGYPGHPGYPVGVPGFNNPIPGGFSGSFSSASSSSSSSTKGGSYSSSSSNSGSVSGGGRPVRPVIPAPVPEVTPEFSLPDGMCRSSAC